MSQLVLLRVLLAFRLLILVLLPVQEGLGKGLAGHENLWEGLVIAALYTLVLSVFSRRVLAFHLRSWAFTGIDLGIVFALYYITGSGSSWPLFLLGSTTVLIPGLRGRVGGSILTAVVWSLITSLAWVGKGVPVGEAFGISSFNDLFNLSLVAAIWVYSIGLVVRLNRAQEDLDSSREALAKINLALDDREKVILGLLDVGNAILSRVDLGGILAIVCEALDGMSFGRCRPWLLHDGRLQNAAVEQELVDVAADSGGPLARAVSERCVTSVRPRSDGVEPSDLPGVDGETLAIIVPVFTEAETFGAIVVESRSGDPFTDEETDLLQLFSEVIALALRHRRFYEAARDHAVAEERHRLSVELRGTILRDLGSAIEHAQTLEGQALTSDSERKMRLVVDTLHAGIQDLGVAVLDWDSLDWTGDLTETAQGYIERFSELSGISVTWDARGTDHGLASGAAKDLLRIIQEALANAWRHGSAGSAAVSVVFGADGADLSIQDDGTGFEVESAEGGSGLGLRSIRARGERNQGRTSIASAPGEGTQVCVWIPTTGRAT